MLRVSLNNSLHWIQLCETTDPDNAIVRRNKGGITFTKETSMEQKTEQQIAKTTSQSTPSRRPFLKGLLTGGLITGLLAGGATVFANADHYSHFLKVGGCKQGHSMRDPVVMQERAGFMADWVLKRVDATEAQKSQVKATLQVSINKMLELRNQHHQNRDAMRAALTQPTVDRAELERIRVEEMKLAETASTTLVNSIADMADVLEPEQRQVIADMAARWSGRGHGRGHAL
jgi:Spy/CpxP family protein refolding chaperone